MEGSRARSPASTTSAGRSIGTSKRSASSSGEPLDFEKEVAPWLGEDAGIFLTEYDGDDFNGTGIAVEVTDTGEAQDFIDERVQETLDGKPEDASYEGVDYKVDSGDGSAIGVVGNFVVYGSTEDVFKEAVDASDGESLADVGAYTSIASASPEGSFADAYVDIGGLIEESGSNVDPQTRQFFEAAGYELDEATALLSLVPGSDSLEVDLASKLGDAEELVVAPPAEKLLGSMPADSLAALAGADFGQRLGKAIDGIDESGIPGQVPPGQLKNALKKAGIDLDKITSNLGDAAVFATGSSRDTLGGAAVIETKNSNEATNTVSNIGLLLRANGTPGVTAVTGKASGFSVRNSDLGKKPLVVAAEGERIAVGYGLAETISGLASGSGATLSDQPAYKEAVAALGGTPISGFADGPAALRLAEGLVPGDEQEKLAELKPYLAKIAYLAIGADTEGDLAKARLVVGLAE